jgi:hypothetical protein
MFTDAGFAVVVLRGKYRAAGFVQEAKKLGLVHMQVDGFDVIEHPNDRSAAVILASNERLVVAGSPRGELSLAQVNASLKRGKGTFADNQQFVKLIQSVDRSKPVWAATMPGDSRLGISGIEHINSMTLEVAHHGVGLAAVCKVRANDFDALKHSFTQVIQLRDYIKGVSPGLLVDEPHIKPALDFVSSIELADDGKEFTLTGKLSDTAELLMMPVLVGRGGVK